MNNATPFKWHHNAAYLKAIADLKGTGLLPRWGELRQVKYFNNTLVEQDHRFLKRLVKPVMGFFSFETAGRTLQGYEVMNMLPKVQMHGVEKGNVTGQISFIANSLEEQPKLNKKRCFTRVKLLEFLQHSP